MAIIPRSTPQVADIGSLAQVRNTTQVQAPTGLAAAVGSVVAAGAEFVQQRADRADTAAVMDGQRQLSDWQNTWFDPNNQSGIRKYQGIEALKLSDAMLPDFEKRASEIELRLPSNRARQKFREYAGSELQQVRGRINSYALQESDAAENAMRNAFEETRRNDMIGALLEGDEQRAATTFASTAELINANAAASGRSAEETQLRLAKLQSDIHTGVLDVLVSRNPQEAEAYFRRHVDKILPTQQAGIERAIRPLLIDSTAEQGMRAIVYGGELPDAALGFEGPSDGKAPAKVPNTVRNVIETAANKHGVPLPIALALAEQESGFDPKAVGAQTQWGRAGGLFQFLEQTAKDKGIDRFNPEQAADAAMEDLAREAKARGWDWAVAHHFAGPDESRHGPKTRAYVDEVRTKARRHAGTQGGRSVPAAQDKTEALAMVQRIPDPQLRRAMAARVRDEFDIIEARQKAAEQQAANDIYQKIAAADPRAPMPQLLTRQELAIVGQNSALSEAINRFRKITATGQVIEDDPVLVDRLARLQATDPNAFRAERLAEYADRLSGKTLLALTKDQQEASKPEKRAQWISEDQQLSLAFDDMGLTGATRVQDRGEFRKAFYSAKREAIERNGGKAITAEETQTIINRLKLPFVKSGFLGFGGGTRRAFQGAAPGFQVPDEDRERIIQAYRRAGRVPTEQDIVDYYLEDVGSAL